MHRAIESLQKKGFNVIIAETGEEAKNKVLELVPKGSEVMTMTSMSCEQIGLTQVLNESPYVSARNKLYSMDRATQGKEMKILGATSDVTVGSVHAVTEDGHVLVASQSGSQLPAYAFASPKVVWVVGAQKIVPDLDAAMRRITDHCLPLESVRAQKAYGVPHSEVNKILIYSKEVVPNRTTIVFVKQPLGF